MPYIYIKLCNMFEEDIRILDRQITSRQLSTVNVKVKSI